MKSTKAIIAKRVQEVSISLIAGESRFAIVQNGSKKWKITERQVDKYIDRARTTIQKEVIKDLEYDYAKALRRFEDLYRIGMEKENYKLAMSANREIVKLQSLTKVQLEHSGDINFITNIPE